MGEVPREIVTSFFFKQALLLGLKLAHEGWLGSELQGPAYLCLPISKITNMCHPTPKLLHGFRGWNSCLYSKNFTN